VNVSRYLIASTAAMVWIFAYGFVVNAILLADFWAAQTAPGLMRPEGEEVVWAMMASMAVQAFALGFIFTRGYDDRGWSEGLRFGLLVAWFVAGLYLLFYALQPWNLTSTVVSIAVDGLMYVGAGIVLALLYRD